MTMQSVKREDSDQHSTEQFNQDLKAKESGGSSGSGSGDNSSDGGSVCWCNGGCIGWSVFQAKITQF